MVKIGLPQINDVFAKVFIVICGRQGVFYSTPGLSGDVNVVKARFSTYVVGR